MKKTLFLFVICFSFNVSAQNPDVVGTWYLKAYTADLQPNEPITSQDFPQNPSLTINPDLSYTGLGACNTFSGNIVLIDGDEYSSNNFSSTTMNCGNTNYNNSEAYYFNHFNGTLSQTIYIYSGGSQLLWEFAPGFGLEFQDTVFLSIGDNTMANISMYPNPVTNKLNINLKGGFISHITIYTTTGQCITSEIYDGEAIDVSLLKSGIYFLELISEGKKMTKRFIKE